MKERARGARRSPPRKRSTAARKRIPKRGESHGPAADAAPIPFDDPAIAETVERVKAAGGGVAGAYLDPHGAGPLVVALLPIEAVAPTPFQRELSPTHTRRLAERIEQSGAFLDPVIAVADPSGPRFWTPNGRHRLAAAGALGLRAITALVSPNAELAFKILALNTEKAHNLRDRSLEVIRMARALVSERKGAKESDFVAEFESAPLLTLGILYEANKRFSGGAYLPMLRKVDRFGATPLASALRSREGYAARIADIDRDVDKVVERLKERGFKSPYLRAFVVARVNPVRWIREKRGENAKPPMPVGEALTRMARSIRQFDVSSVKTSELAMVAALAPAETTD